MNAVKADSSQQLNAVKADSSQQLNAVKADSSQQLNAVKADNTQDNVSEADNTQDNVAKTDTETNSLDSNIQSCIKQCNTLSFLSFIPFFGLFIGLYSIIYCNMISKKNNS